MKEIKDNPLNTIFIQNGGNKYSPEIKSLKNISNFFIYLKEPKNSQDSKSKIIEEFIKIIKENRYICEYFSSNENKSIYIFLFELYLQEKSSDTIKKSILNLIKELILNIEVDKKIFEFIFQKLSLLYREEEKISPDSLSKYLTLLNSIISEIENRKKPHNYFCCNGEGHFSINLSELELSINFSISFIINFKIGNMGGDKNKKILSNLLKINFVNEKSINIDLEYPKSLIVKDIKDTPLKTFPENEWINLIITITGAENKIALYFLVNGETQLSQLKYPTTSITYKDNIGSIELFNNFFGEVSSIIMLNQNKDFESASVPPNEFLSEFKLYKEGLWKRKKIYNFMTLLEKTNNIKRKNKLNLLFMFTPLNKVYNTEENMIESSCGSLMMKYTGNIRLHNYQCYQKKLYLVKMIKNILPIPEMFLVHPQLLTEANLQLFLEIIIYTLKFRKKNMKYFKECKFFQILSLFVERYPKTLFNEKTLEKFWEIGKSLFASKFEILSSNYFKHILLNEKILSKYSEDLQVKFWNNLSLFTQSDKYQVSNHINLNKVCLILRFYDRNKYTEICCEKHLSMIKDEYIGNKTIMNPTMSKKLSYLENILTSIINSQEPKNACSLFKLLTLDLSPCLTLFIINIFIKAFQKDIKTVKWKDQLIMELINNKYEVIITNAYLHGLPEIRFEILKLMHEIHLRLLTIGKGAYFIPFEKMIKTCFLPQNMFYYSKDGKNNTNKIENKKSDNNITNEFKRNDLRAGSIKLDSKANEIAGHKKMINEIKPTKEEEEENIMPSMTLNPKKIVEIEKELNTNTRKKGNSILDRVNVFSKNASKTNQTNKVNKPINKTTTNASNNASNKKEPPKEQTKSQTKLPNTNKPKDNLTKNTNTNTNTNSTVKTPAPKTNINSNKNANTNTNNNDKNSSQTNNETNKKIETNKENNNAKNTITKNNTNKKIETNKEAKNSSTTNSNIKKTETNKETNKEKSKEKSKETNKETSKEKSKETNKDNVNEKKVENNNEKNKENSFLIEKKEINGILIFKENLLKDYKDKLFNIFYLWALGVNLEDDINKINFEKNPIKNPNIIEILFAYIKELNDINYTNKFLEKLQLFVSNPQSSYTIFSNKKIYSIFLDFTFSFYKMNDKRSSECYNKGKSIILDIFINSILYMEKNHSINPCSDIDTIFIWAHGVYERIKDKNKIFDFLNQFLFECLTFFKVKFEPKMKYNLKDPNFKPKSNFYLKNYFIFITYLYEFCFLYKYEIENDLNSLNADESKKLNSEFLKYLSSIRFNNNAKGEINQKWIDYPFFEDIYKRFNSFWGYNSTIQKIFKSQKKGNKVLKYEEILNQSILDKDNKNLFFKELELLCLEEKIVENSKKTKDNKKPDIIIAPLDLITISIMCILSVTDSEKDLKYWLKELKYFLRFLIISSSNLLQNNQLEIYNSMQEKILCILSALICFLNDLLNKFKANKSPFKEKTEKILQKTLLFCLIVTKYQYKYALEHKNKLKIFNILSKNQNQNDLSSCAVVLLFSEYIKDKTNLPILTQEKLDQLALSQYVTVVDHFNKPEIVEAFYENKKLKNLIDSKFYFLSRFVSIVEERNENMKNLIDDYDYKYKEDILSLLPLYEKELMKYSNNSLEKNIKYKNIYKIYKKQSFSWMGLWSDRKLFFENKEKLKLKLVNHISKTLMKPVLSPILDMSYYLPEFSGFKVDSLFNKPKDDKDKKTKNNFKLSMDIDKILRSSEINQITMNNIKESFGGKKAEIKENYLRDIYNKSSSELANSLLKIANHLDFGKEEEFFFIEKENKTNDNNNTTSLKKNKKYFLSCLVKPSHHIKGVCFIDEKSINFKVFLNQKTGNAMSGVEVGFTTKDDDYDKERQTCFGSYFVCHPKDKDLYKIAINYDEIKWFFRRRYYYQNSGLEIYTVNNKSFYFNFKFEEDREIVINEILSKLKDCIKIVDDLKDNKDIFENVIGYDNFMKNKKIKKIKMSKKIELWKEWEISNFELIMWLNIYANRSYNDLSQYPVFPWLITNFEDPIIEETTPTENNENTDKKKNKDEERAENDNIPKEKYRDLSLPMGMLTTTDEGKNRRKVFLHSFENLKRDNNPYMIPYMFGSNYSNPTYVCNYMTRIFPYTQIGIELQGDKFDDPNRLFTSIKSSFKSAITQKSDVRELIPEFFYLPEMFINLNDLDMGIKDDGVKVNDVIVPCQNNPYEFTLLLRNILENDTISYNINYWVDLIFGCKNKGKEAELANNVFTDTSYQEDVDLKKVENRDLFLRYAEFGLVPNQVMSKECEKKMKREEKLKGKEITNPKASLLPNECKPPNVENPQFVIKNNSNVLLIKSFAEGKITMLLNDFIYIEKKISKSFNEEIVTYIKLNDNDTIINSMSEYYSENSCNNKCLRFYNNGKSIIMGGFYDGKLMVFSIESKKKNTLYPFIEERPILCIEIDNEENYLFLGNSQGNVCIYQIESDISKWNIIHLKTDQISPISHIHCSNDLNLWSSATIDGYINIYTYPKCKLTRCIKVPTNKLSYAFLSSSPLPSVIAISDEENNSELYVYSINGSFMFKQQEYVHMNNPILIKDIYSFEYLVFVGRDNINIRKLPNLDCQRSIDKLLGVYTFCITDDNKTIYTVDKNGKKVFVVKD